MSDWVIRVHYADDEGVEDHEDVNVYDEPDETSARRAAVEWIRTSFWDVEEVLRTEVVHEWS